MPDEQPPTHSDSPIYKLKFSLKNPANKPSTSKTCTLKDLIVFILRLFCTFGTNSLCQLQRRMEENQHSDQSIFYLQINTLTSLYFTFRSTFGPVYILLQINTLTSLYFTFRLTFWPVYILPSDQHSDQSIFYLQINTLTSLYFTFRSTFWPVYIFPLALEMLLHIWYY